MADQLISSPGSPFFPAPNPKRQEKRPMYRRVYQSLRKRLQNGEWAPGTRLPTLTEMAHEFKVSTSTIRGALRVLEKDGSVYQVPDVGAFVRPSAPVHAATCATVAVAMIDIGGAFEMQIAHGVEHVCQDRHWDLKIYNARHDQAIEASNLTRLAASGCRGAIVMPIGNNANLEHLVKLKLSGFPLVLVDRGIIGLNVDVVASDNEKGAYQATEHLIEHGHRRLFMVSDAISPVPETTVLARVRGFQRSLSAHSIELAPNGMVWVDPERAVQGVREGQRWLGGYEAALPVLKSVSGPIGVFALNDYIAWGTVQACRALKLNIPEDVSLVCFDDSDITRALDLTVVAQKPCEIGRKAFELLERRLQPGGADLPTQQVYVDVELIERGSVLRLPGMHPASNPTT